MKKIAAVFIFILCFLSLSAEPVQLDAGLSVNEVKTGLFIVTHIYPWTSNSLVAVMGKNDILIIDTPYTPAATELMLNWINKTFGKLKITAINTHFHIDRLGGNEALVKAGINIYTSELTIKAIKENGRKSLDFLTGLIKNDEIKLYYKSFQYIMPDKIFDSSKGLVLKFGNETAEVKYYGTGHSFDNLIVYLPGKKTIFGGCMILPLEAKSTGNASDGNVYEWNKTIRKLITKNYDLVIPGHGKEGGIELINHTKSILENIR